MAAGSHRVVQAPRPGMPRPRDCLQPRTLRTRHEPAAVYVRILAAANTPRSRCALSIVSDGGAPDLLEIAALGYSGWSVARRRGPKPRPLCLIGDWGTGLRHIGPPVQPVRSSLR